MRKAQGLTLFGIWLLACSQVETKVDEAADAADAAGVVDKFQIDAADQRQYEDELRAQIEELDVRFEMQTVRYDPETKVFTNLTPPPTKRNLFAVEELEGRLYVLGGLDEDGNYSSALERYEPETDRWETLASWPNPGFAFVNRLGSLLCAIGGYQDLDEPIRREVDCYDPESNTWSEREPVPEGYSSFYPIVYDDRVYILGGTDESSITHVVDSAWMYEPTEDRWQALSPLPEPRGAMGAVAVQDRIYLTGGFGDGTFAEETMNDPQDRDMLIYDPADDSWGRAADMPHSRALYGIDSIEGKVAVFFGLTDGPLVELYDPDTDSWSEGTDPPELPDGGVYTYVKHDEQMHLFAIADQLSISKISASGTLWRYDEPSNEWSELARRGSEEEDALFVGDSVADQIFWVGARTILVY
jgi:hypothetical protein